MRIYSLYDRKLKEYGSLVLQNNDEAVKRMCKDALENARADQSPLKKYPEDFDLMWLGEFDPEVGVITGTVPLFVCNVAELAIIPPAEIYDAGKS